MVRNRNGFTMVEMMTVIAIIVILAAIMLPVLMRAREQTRRTECMSNLHQIATALKLYRLDERAYPFDLSETGPGKARPIVPGDRWFGPGIDTDKDGVADTPTRAGAGYGLASLFPDYVESIKVFNCPDNDAAALKDPDNRDPGDPDFAKPTYTYQSYDGFDPLLAQLKYQRFWKPQQQANDPDYLRQLCWRYPPEDTVVTWCTYHRKVSDPTDPAATQFRPGDQDIVLYLDGSTRVVPSVVAANPRLGSGHLSTPGEE
ncbi:MAG: DUF1559 domain-containing protein [Armatimonadota bacterium]|nr:DUF1559 domain-containing protein [Armatimonadota bacterium]